MLSSIPNQILLFDGVCNLCIGVVKFVIRNDQQGKIKFAALQSVSGQALLKRYQLPVNHFETFVFISNGKVLMRSSAVLHVAKIMGGRWKIFYMLMIVPKFIRDFIYQLVANSRYKIFGRKPACMVPTPELMERFLD